MCQGTLPVLTKGKACQACKWVFHAASCFFCHNCSNSLFSQTIRRANMADEPIRLHITPDY